MILFHFAVSLSVSFCVVTKSLTEPFAKWNFLRQFILQLTECYREVRPEHCIQFIIVSALAITTTIYYNHATINNVETHNITDFQKFF